ncbi:ABC transporter permease [Microcoleus sp. FACHB-1515]|uniref:ABC transporter permease n=1 Tax=Cyanophyceae TaxID=3028117 RepID=UPI001686ACEE|nr:ABC transporter permease [Microcoleus sp. FACHB-1515]MBD2088806.1 ABC transporter permease [Microcoleus sp. FACHB-1515]
MNAIELSPTNMAWLLGLAAITLGLLTWQRSQPVNMTIAIGRMLLQLGAIGVVFSVVFASPNLGLVLAIVLLMLAVAVVTARSRLGDLPNLLMTVGVLVGSVAIALIYLYLLVLRPNPWYAPQYLIPLAGLLLAASANAIAQSGERLITSLKSSRIEIETHLSLGANPQQAIATFRHDAIKAGILPTLNAMLIAGAATLPGVFCGLVLAGVDPFQAALYQVVVLVSIAFVAALSSILITQAIARQFFNAAWQFNRR